MQKVVISRAAKSLHIPSSTLCPFLYQTRTIIHQRARHTSAPEQPHQDGDTTLTFLQRKARDVEARRDAMESSITPTEREIFTNIMKNFGAKIDGIAYPPPASSSESELYQKAQLTKQESMAVPSPPQSGSSSVHVKNTNIDEILSIFAPADTNEQFTLFSNDTVDPDLDAGTESTIPSTKSNPQNVRHAALQSLEHVSANIKSALSTSTTLPDHALWQILETDIFPIITLMRTHRSPLNVNPYQRPISSLPIEVLPTSLSLLPPETPFLPLITILYPAATLLALRTYVSHFPTSGFILALLPKIRSLGPASYLLAGNTHFFNALMYIQWTIYSDLRGVHTILKEMQRNGVEHDQGTLNLIEEISVQRQEGLREGRNPGSDNRAGDWWRLKRQEEGWRKLMRKYRHDILKEGRGSRQLDDEDHEQAIDQEIR